MNAGGGDNYLRNHIEAAASTGLVTMAVALIVAYLLYRIGPKRQAPNAEFHLRGNVWTRALGARPKGTLPWVGLQLTDGTLIEGVLHSMSLHDGEERVRAASRGTNNDRG